MPRWSRLKPIKLIVNSKVKSAFRKQAVRDFPKETVAFLLGYDLGDTIEVVDLWTPPADIVTASNSEIDWEEHVEWEVHQHAKENELVVVGDIHTHPWNEYQVKMRRIIKESPQIHPSETDWDYRRGLRWITGICLIEERPRGFWCRFRYWGPMVPLTLVEE